MVKIDKTIVVGQTLTITGPFTPGAHWPITIIWADGTQTLNYTVAASEFNNLLPGVAVGIFPASVESPPPGEQLILDINITDGEDVAGYQLTLQFDATALRYVVWRQC